MGSYDDHVDNQSELDLDFSVFDNSDDEYAASSWSEDEDTLVGSDMEMEYLVESETESNVVDRGISTSRIFNMEPMAEAVETPVPSRSATPESASDDSDATVHAFSPDPLPMLRPTLTRVARNAVSMSRSSTPCIERSSSPTPSSFSSSSSVVKTKVERKSRGLDNDKKRSSVGRNEEKRKVSNRVAQKTCRMKVLNSTAMMSATLVDIFCVLKSVSFETAEDRLKHLQSITHKYRVAFRAHDPTTSKKQEQSVRDQLGNAE